MINDNTSYIANKIGPFFYCDGDTAAGRTFEHPGYTLTGFSTQQDGNGGTFYPIGSAFTITADHASGSDPLCPVGTGVSS